jgi:glycosyltransferase involved in cell wall biosynthesis
MLNHKFKIITPFFNSETWIGACITLIKNQTYKKFQCILIDDCSEDNSYNIAKKMIGNDNRFVLKKNEKRVGALHNISDGIKGICNDDNDIVVLVDGDDLLYDDSVLQYLNNIYVNSNVWLTYGSYIEMSDLNDINFIKNSDCNQVITDILTIRREKINFSHLRTFRYFLWKGIDDKDLRNSVGQYFKVTWDVAMMLPMVEMAGLDRVKRVEKILYIYNNLNPLNDYKLYTKLQSDVDNYIRHKPSYNRIDI